MSGLVNRPHPAFCRCMRGVWDGIWLLHGDLWLNMAINFLAVNLQHSLAFSMTWKPQACRMRAIVKSHMTRWGTSVVSHMSCWVTQSVVKVTWPSCESHDPVVRVTLPSCKSHMTQCFKKVCSQCGLMFWILKARTHPPINKINTPIPNHVKVNSALLGNYVVKLMGLLLYKAASN